jgi:Fur family ferric uptake transcriptional regulator
MKSKRKYHEILKNENLKSTKHRHAIIEILDNNKYPITADDIFIKIKEKGHSISLSTVYRTLDTLTARDIVIKSSIADKNQAIYELNRNRHHHYLLCVKCRKILTVGNCPLEEYEKMLEDRFGFKIKGHNLEVFGYCTECAVKENL